MESYGTVPPAEGVTPPEEALHQVWAVVYDGDPLMSGGTVRRVVSERSTLEQARKDILRARQGGPKDGLRVETRMVSEWKEVRIPAPGQVWLANGERWSVCSEFCFHIKRPADFPDVEFASRYATKTPGEFFRVFPDAELVFPLVQHTGMEAHDGYDLHSHEVRPDHRGVQRKPAPGSSA